MNKNNINKQNNISKLFNDLRKRGISPQECNKKLYEVAITHSSFDSENNNLKLAFYGDAIINLIITEYFYNKNLTIQEMNDKKVSVINNNFFAKIIKRKVKWQDLLLVNLEKNQKPSEESKVWADMFEAIIGAINKDLGYEKTKIFIEKLILEDQKETNYNNIINNKNLSFGHKLNKLHCKGIKYETKCEGNICTTVISLNNKKIASASAKTKKRAKEKAAEIFLNYLNKTQYI